MPQATPLFLYDQQLVTIRVTGAYNTIMFSHAVRYKFLCVRRKVTMDDTRPTEIELEVTCLAGSIPAELAGATPKEILDVYIPAGRDIHSKLRLRKKGDKYEITKKVLINADDASAQQEFTIPIVAAEFETLAVASDKRVQKHRYQVVIEGYDAEVDVFQGSLEGLVLIDFEFASLAEKTAFTQPACCLEDVTQEEFIAGGQLAGRSYDDISADLNRFGYTRLSLN